MRFTKILTTVFVLLAVSINFCWSANYPSKPIEFVVHVSAGGGSDIFARLIADIIKKENLCTQPISIINKPGGGAAASLNYIAERKDPHILEFYALAAHLSAFMKARIQADRKDFIPVASFADEMNIFAINTASPYKDLKGLVAEAKKIAPKKLSVGFGSIGGTGHLLAYMFAKKAGIDFNYLAHKSGGEAPISLIGGRVALCTENPSEMLQFVKAGKLKIIGVPTDERLADMPDVPTLKEQGYDVVFGSSRGVVAFKGITDEEISYWVAVFKKVFDSETFQNFLKENFMRPNFMSGPKLSKYLDEKYEIVKPITDEMGLNK